MTQTFILPGVPHAIFWLFVALAVLIQGLSKSGFAGGVGILSLPLMMLVMPVDKVAATLLPILILCDINAVWHHRTNKIWKHIWAVYIPAIAGILLGALVWWWVGREGVEHYGGFIKRFVGVIAIIFACYILGRERALAWVTRYTPGPRAAILTGLAAGFCSTIAHAAGPIVSLYMFAQNMGKSMFVGTMAWTFTLINLTKLPFYIAVDLIGRNELLFALVLIWLIPIGSWIGKTMHDKVSEKTFNRVIMIFVFMGGLQLLTNTNLILTLAQTLSSS